VQDMAAYDLTLQLACSRIVLASVSAQFIKRAVRSLIFPNYLAIADLEWHRLFPLMGKSLTLTRLRATPTNNDTQ
jgi:hypothetical protein